MRMAWRCRQLAVTFVIGLSLTMSASVLGDTRPNIVLILTDDQRWDMLGVVRPELHTPTMDRLARDGTRF